MPRKTVKKSTKKPAAKAVKKPVKKAASKTARKTTVKTATKAAAPTASADALTGVRAPTFRLPRDGGATLALGDFAGRKLVIFFYPKANTPGCTREAIDFTRLAPHFAKAGTAVIGVSADSPKAQESFRDKHALAVPLGADETRAMLKAYGAWGQKMNYGKVYEGIIRSTVLIGADGRVARVWRNVKVDGHAEAVLEAARAL